MLYQSISVWATILLFASEPDSADIHTSSSLTYPHTAEYRVKTNLTARGCYETWCISSRSCFISLCSEDSLPSFRRLYCLFGCQSACHCFPSFSTPSPQFLNVSQFQSSLTQRQKHQWYKVSKSLLHINCWKETQLACRSVSNASIPE